MAAHRSPAPVTTALVTGGTGFLGRRVVARLRSQGCDVTTLARRGGDVEIDLADPNAAREALVPWCWDVCVHLAAPVTGGSEDLQTGIEAALVHARIALNVRHFCRTRIVYASSMTVYGLPQTIPVDENHPRQPRHLYGLGKAIGEDVLFAEPTSHVIALRFGGLFAEDRREGALFHFCRNARAGNPLRVAATTPTPWELLHVDDAADGIVRAIAAGEDVRGPINLGYGEPIELEMIARRIAAIAGRGSVVETQAAVTHPRFQLDVSRARRYLEWNPPSLESRLTELVEAFA